jgi:hypothetical protein
VLFESFQLSQVLRFGDRWHIYYSYSVYDSYGYRHSIVTSKPLWPPGFDVFAVGFAWVILILIEIEPVKICSHSYVSCMCGLYFMRAGGWPIGHYNFNLLAWSHATCNMESIWMWYQMDMENNYVPTQVSSCLHMVSEQKF